MKPKVSIVMPCYNGETTIARAIRGVLKQTYRPIQFILVNDGSTDGTDRIVFEMEKEIKQAGIEFVYHVQQNLGLGGAINTGLKFVNGEYLAWVDADDELMPESVMIRVKFLEDNHQYGSVSSNAVTAEDQEWSRVLGKVTEKIQLNSEPDQFVHLLLGQSLFCSGCHLIRTDVFQKANGGMEIFPARHGQNWQLLLPVYYSSKHAFLDIPLYKYRIDVNSMDASARRMSVKRLAQRRQEHTEIVRHTLNKITGMTAAERKRYLWMHKKRSYEQNLDTAIERKDLLETIKWRAVVRCLNRLPWLR